VAGLSTDGNVEKFDEVADAIRRLVKKTGSRTKQVAMALAPSAVITKKIILPGGMKDTELEQQVELEANQYIPFPLEEVESGLLCDRAQRHVGRGRRGADCGFSA